MTDKTASFETKDEAKEVPVGETVIREYFREAIPNLGLATATMNGVHPPAPDYWLRNRRVDEFYFVISGSGRLRLGDGGSFDLVPDSAALIRKGVAFRVEDAHELYVVVPTSPAWAPDQYETLGASDVAISAGDS